MPLTTLFYIFCREREEGQSDISDHTQLYPFHFSRPWSLTKQRDTVEALAISLTCHVFSDWNVYFMSTLIPYASYQGFSRLRNHITFSLSSPLKTTHSCLPSPLLTEICMVKLGKYFMLYEASAFTSVALIFNSLEAENSLTTSVIFAFPQFTQDKH